MEKGMNLIFKKIYSEKVVGINLCTEKNSIKIYKAQTIEI